VSALGARLRGIRKGPLAIAGILAAPLFFCSLMGASLAIARPQIFSWLHDGHRRTVFHQPTSAEEARIWAWSLLPLGIMLAIGLLACLWRYGVYLSCAGGIVLALGVTHRVGTWERHHTARWPRGIDNIPDAWTSDTEPRGAWEHGAAVAAYSLSHWTIGLALTTAVVYTLVLYRRMRTRARVALMDAAGTAEAAPIV
jgi:hypothetical protein